MKNSEQPAFPLITRGGAIQDGLTKREYFAAMALNGYISAGNQGMPEPEQLAAYAISAADELLKQLENK